MEKINIALLFGGDSPERSVSLDGGSHVYQAIDKNKYNVVIYDPKKDLKLLIENAKTIDFAFLVLHGLNGEDGRIQGFLDLLGIPYQGSGVTGSVLAMNKVISKKLYQQNGICVPPYIFVDKNSNEFIKQHVELGFPLVVKPVSGGSSLGMSVVYKKSELEEAVYRAFAVDSGVLIESFIEGREITVGVIGNLQITPLPVVEIICSKSYAFFDYNAKYIKGVTKEICPAKIDSFLTKKAQKLAKSAHAALFCSGYSRTDMIIKNDIIYVLETNTIPGMTETSLLPIAAKAFGISFDKLIDKLIKLGLEKGKQ